MPGFLKQSTASQSRALGPFVSDSDFKTVQTGLTIANTDIKLIVNGAASANKNSGGGTHRANGVYGVTFDATDTATIGEMEVSVVVAGALPVFDKFTVVIAAVYDMLYGSSAIGYIANQPVDLNTIKTNPVVNAGTVTFPTTATLASTTNIASGTISALSSGAITNASFAADVGFKSVRSNTAQAGASTSITLDASAAGVQDFYKNMLIVLTGGTGIGQARFITAYDFATKIATVSAWTVNPNATTTFAILPFDAIPGATAPTSAQVATAVWTDLLAGSDFSTASSIGKLLKDDIDAAISSRMATYTQPTGFLAATFPSGTVANTTNITAATGVDITKILGTAISTPATAGVLDVNMKNVGNQIASAAGTVTFPGTVASATNITSATGIDVTKWSGTTVAVPATAGIPEVNTKNWNNIATVALPLIPTTAGRTLDVTATGEAGIDWANIGAPTTVVNLSGTTVKTATDIATQIGTNGNGLTSVAVGTGGITNASFAAAAIDAAAIAADAIGSSELATSAVNEIRDAMFARAFSAAYGSLTFDQLVSLMSAALLAKCSGMATATGVFRNLADSADTITATIDANGNRTAVTLVP